MRCRPPSSSGGFGSCVCFRCCLYRRLFPLLLFLATAFCSGRFFGQEGKEKREAQQHPPDSKWRRGSQNGDPVLSYFASGYESAKVSVCRLEPGSTDQREPEEKESDHDLAAGVEHHITIPRISMG